MDPTGTDMATDTPLNAASNLRRDEDRGIILITTLLLLTLLAGFAIAAQNRAISQAQVLERVIELDEERIAVQSARALVLPLIGERLLDGIAGSPISLQSEDQVFEVRLEPVQRAEWYRMLIVWHVD